MVYPESVRLEAVRLYESSYSMQQIAELLSVNKFTVSRWIARAQESGSIARIKPSGRYPALSPAEKLDVVLKAQEEPFISARKIIDDLDLDVNEQTVRSELRKAGLNSRHAAKKILMKDQHRRMRIEFATFYIGFDWRKAVFLDEVCFWTEKDGIKFVRRPNQDSV